MPPPRAPPQTNRADNEKRAAGWDGCIAPVCGRHEFGDLEHGPAEAPAEQQLHARLGTAIAAKIARGDPLASGDAGDHRSRHQHSGREQRARSRACGARDAQTCSGRSWLVTFRSKTRVNGRPQPIDRRILCQLNISKMRSLADCAWLASDSPRMLRVVFQIPHEVRQHDDHSPIADSDRNRPPDHSPLPNWMTLPALYEAVGQSRERVGKWLPWVPFYTDQSAADSFVEHAASTGVMPPSYRSPF